MASIVKKGTLTSATSVVEIAASDYENIMVQIAGTSWSGDIQFQGSLDGTNYRNMALVVFDDTVSTLEYQTSFNGFWSSVRSTAGLQYFRVKFSLYMSGTATVTIAAGTSAK